MFNVLLSTCTIGSFVDSLIFNSEECIKYISLNNRPCQAGPTPVNITSNEFLNCPFTVNVNQCGESCNTIDDAYAQLCAPDKAKIWMQKYFIYIEGKWNKVFSVAVVWV